MIAPTMDRSLASSSCMGKSNILCSCGSAPRFSREEQFNQDVGRRLRMFSNRVEFCVRQFDRLIAQQFPTTLQTYSFGVICDVGDVVHTCTSNPLACGTLKSPIARTIT